MKAWNKLLQKYQDRPYRSLGWLSLILICLSFAILIVDGQILTVWSLHRQKKAFLIELSDLESKNKNLKLEVSKMESPDYLERKVIEKFEYLGPNDLLFVFSDDDQKMEVIREKVIPR